MQLAPRPQEIVERGAPILVNNLKSRLGAMFNWGVNQGLATTNPIAGMKPLATRGVRTRYLSETEISQLWSVLDRRPHPSSDVYKLILLTACRPGEALGLRWEEISEDGTVWTLPEERSKNGMEFNPHDLHRTASTHLARLGVREEIREA